MELTTKTKFNYAPTAKDVERALRDLATGKQLHSDNLTQDMTNTLRSHDLNAIQKFARRARERSGEDKFVRLLGRFKQYKVDLCARRSSGTFYAELHISDNESVKLVRSNGIRKVVRSGKKDHKLDNISIDALIELFTLFLRHDKSWITKFDWKPRITLPEIIDTDVNSGVIPPETKDSRAGVIYLLRSGLWYKIGKTTNPTARFKQLDIQLPEKSIRVHQITTNNIDRLERHWHQFFREKRGNGEWFQLTSTDVDEFISVSHVEYQELR